MNSTAVVVVVVDFLGIEMEDEMKRFHEAKRKSFIIMQVVWEFSGFRWILFFFLQQQVRNEINSNKKQ